ncbi:(2,3-dihydroxybenzoyl)adenylate synthase [Actinomycetospora straminea]|uniref:Pyochelin biosynthesis salicyl-AMP ligase PchD n=1 Tax=Actinomycetospora straminea TaxID=663607 RepID=A0ABP9EUU1_9PSEU|nr:AMP-binding protein [Actinomycetospora straminea]MDD7934937.1 AMP-binding protein [Actinomycetospora straminea]
MTVETAPTAPQAPSAPPPAAASAAASAPRTAPLSPAFRPELADRYRREGHWGTKPLGEVLRAVARRRPEPPALVTPESRWTYRDLDAASDAVAAGLLTRTTLRPGDRVMVQLGNVAETVVAYYGAVKAGIVPVCTLPQHGVREIGLLVEHTGARGHLVQADVPRRDLVAEGQRLQETVDGLDTLIVVRGPAPAGAVAFDDLLAAEAAALPDLDPDDVVAFQLSGGTTGLPKVAPRRHHEYAYNSLAWAHALELDEDSVVMHPLPIMHNAGIAAALQPAHLTGGTFVLAPGADAETVLALVERERVTVVPVVPPAVAIRLLDHPRARDTDLGSLRRFALGGQRPSVELLDRLEAELGIPTQQMFGMAEGMFLYTPPESPLWVRRHTVGTPISPADEVRVLDVGTDDEVADGELGEMACRGPYTIPGYHRAEAHNRNAFTADGFYRTGDLVTRHVVDGVPYYAIDGRIKDVINRGAEKIHAEEVEELLVRHPAVHGAALVAMPDAVLGERLCAYVVPAGTAAPTLDELTAFLLDQGLARFKLPERVEAVAAFPLTSVGKVSKKDLRADIAAKLEHEGSPS